MVTLYTEIFDDRFYPPICEKCFFKDFLFVCGGIAEKEGVDSEGMYTGLRGLVHRKMISEADFWDFRHACCFGNACRACLKIVRLGCCVFATCSEVDLDPTRRSRNRTEW